MLDYPHPTMNLFYSEHRPYYIAAGDMVDTHGGAKVPFYICHVLNELGFEAYVTSAKAPHDLRAPQLTREIIERHKLQGRNPIAIYNSVMWGNPLKCQVVVRLCFSSNGYLIKDLFDEGEHLFFFSELYVPENVLEPNFLRVSITDERIFNCVGVDDSKREGFAFYASKYLRDGKPPPTISDKIKDNGISLCQDIKRSQKEIANVLRSVKCLCTFEESAMMPEASLCGCSVILIKSAYTKSVIQGEDMNESADYYIREEEFDINADYPYKGKPKEVSEQRSKKLPEELKRFIDITQNADLHRPTIKPLNQSLYNGKRVFIYGAGLAGNAIKEYLTSQGIEIAGFIVSDSHIERYSDEHFGVRIYSLSSYKAICTADDLVILCTMSDNAPQTERLLKSNNVNFKKYYEVIPKKESIIQNISEQFNRIVDTYPELYILGVGYTANLVYNVLQSVGVKIKGFISVTSDENLISDNHNVNIYSLEEFLEFRSNKCGVIVAVINGEAYKYIPILQKYKVDYVFPSL